ncbi:MAG: DUF2232 domain-containing protein [Bacteriovoracia bacterium]
MEEPKASGSPAGSDGPKPDYDPEALARELSEKLELKLKPPKPPLWLQALPYFMAGLFFISGLFSLVAPLPLLLMGLRKRDGRFWLAVLTNTAIVARASGLAVGAAFLILVLPVAVLMPTLIFKRRMKLEVGVFWTLLGVGALLGASLYALFQWGGVNPVKELEGYVTELVNQLQGIYQERPDVPDSASMPMNAAEAQELVHSILVEFPSALAVFSLVTIWINLVMVLRLNPGLLRERLGIVPNFFSLWKAPEFLVWPTIAAGASLLFLTGLSRDIALNFFRFFMAVYAIQGLSILSFLFDSWKLKGGLRLVAYLVMVFIGMPFLLAVGFFDLWFDFRAKLRQS